MGERLSQRVFACAAKRSAQRGRLGRRISRFYEVGRSNDNHGPIRLGAAANISRKARGPRRGSRSRAWPRTSRIFPSRACAAKFDRALEGREKFSFGFDADFQVESYLRHQGQSFVDRFDANSYLYISARHRLIRSRRRFWRPTCERVPGQAPRNIACSPSHSDWHYPPEDNRAVVRALIAAGAEASYVEVETDKGHDAFLLEEPSLRRRSPASSIPPLRRAGLALGAH